MTLVQRAERRQDGLLVRLLWDPERNQTVLRYRDRRTGDTVLADVPNDRALAAFEHPNVFRPLAEAA